MRKRPVIRNGQIRGQRVDFLLLGLTIALIGFGVLMVFDASVVEAYHEIGDQWYFIKNQSKFALMGMIPAIIALLIPLKKLERLVVPIMFVALLLLTIVLIPGVGTKVQGARRWLDIGPFNLQPSEFAKLALILYLSKWLSQPRPARSFFVLIAVLLGLIMLEPDMGTALVISGISAIMYFLSGVSLKKMGKIVALGMAAIFMLIVLAPYRMNRVKTFFDPSHDPLGVSYHARQVLVSLGSGGFFGTGIGKSRQKYQYLPEASTDSIFAVIGEELGFIGGVSVISVYAFIILRLLSHARHVDDPFAANIVSGVAVWLGVQVILNLTAMIGLVPLTGVPLPLVSYGGSALITCITGVALALNASKRSSQTI